MRLTPELIEGFSKMVLAKNFDDFKPTPSCHKEWWELCCSDDPLVALAAPRGHAKSTAITHTYTLAACLFKNRRFVIIVSDTYEQSVLFLQDIKKELTQNDDLIELFGVQKLLKDAENDIIVQMDDGYNFRIVAKGAEQKMRGLKWSGMRPDLIVCDDLENDEIVLNKERREKFRKWFFNALLPCRSDRGIVRIVGTILHLDALLERLMPKDWDKRAIKTPLRTILDPAKSKAASWRSVRYRAHDEGFLNILLDDSMAFFRKEDFRPYNLEEFDKHPKSYYIAVDLAISEKDRADWSVFVIGALDSNGILYIVDLVRDRLDAKDIVDTIMALGKRYNPDMITIEASMIEKSIGPYLRMEMQRTGQYYPLNVMVPTKDKEQRARGIQARMRAGGVRFNKSADWFPELEQEMRQFPRSRHDDQVDAMAWLGLTLNKMVDAPTNREVEIEEQEKELYEFGWMDQGRSLVCGY